MKFMLKERDGADPLYAEELRDLHMTTFLDSAILPDFEVGHWWLAYDRDLWASGVKKLAGFAGLTRSEYWHDTGYLKRAGVLHAARGHGLQRKLLTVRESRARRNGWRWMITDTTDNPASANSLINAGYKIFEPTHRWAFPHSIYWRKDLTR